MELFQDNDPWIEGFESITNNLNNIIVFLEVNEEMEDMGSQTSRHSKEGHKKQQ